MKQSDQEIRLVEMQSKLLAQSYLLEILLGSIISPQPDPINAINNLRFELVAQLRDDHLPGRPGFPSPDATAAVVESATNHLNQMFDRLASQFELQPPPRHTA